MKDGKAADEKESQLHKLWQGLYKKITCGYALYGYYDSTNLMGIVDETRNSKVIINLFAYPDSQGTGFPQNRKPQL